MSRTKIHAQKHSTYQFIGCDGCHAKCCSSHIIFLTFFDYERVSKHFPIFFYINDNNISLVYFFHSGNDGQKCHYLLANDLCGIYDERPYACQAYPFEQTESQHVTADFNHCPGLVTNTNDLKGIPLIVNKKINKEIPLNFLRQDFLQQEQDVRAETDLFIRFCLEHKLLTPYANSTLAQHNVAFASQHIDHSYIVHQQKAAVLSLKYGKDNPQHYNRIRQHLQSLNQLERISKANV